MFGLLSNQEKPRGQISQVIRWDNNYYLIIRNLDSIYKVPFELQGGTINRRFEIYVIIFYVSTQKRTLKSLSDFSVLF